MAVADRSRCSFVLTCPPSSTTGRTARTMRPVAASVTESECYGLKLSRLVTPPGGHRFNPLSDIGCEGPGQEPGPERGRPGPRPPRHGRLPRRLYGALAHGLRRDRTARGDLRRPDDRQALWETQVLITVLAVLFGTIGGFSILLSMAGFSQVRVWNRIVHDHRLLRPGDRGHLVRASCRGGCGRGLARRAGAGLRRGRRSGLRARDGIAAAASALSPDRQRVEPRRGLRRRHRASDAARVRRSSSSR